MQEYALYGSPEELGRQFAAHLDREGRTLQSVSPEPLDPPDAKRAFARECVPHVEEHAPWLLDELHGIADGLGVDPATVTLVPLALDSDHGCSIVGIGSDAAGGSPLLGRNHDFFPSFRRYSKLFRTRPDDGYASVGCASTYVGRLDGFNEAGLAIGFAGVPTDEDVPGVMWPLAIRAALDTCATVEEAVSYIQGVPHARNVNFVIVDAGGDVAVVEASPHVVETIRPDDGVAVATRQFATESMRAYQSGGGTPAECSRFRTLRKWLDERIDGRGAGRIDGGGIDAEALQNVLSDPEAGVCWRLDEAGDDPRSTIWSWTIEPKAGVGHLAKGSPVEVAYEPVRLSVSGG